MQNTEPKNWLAIQDWVKNNRPDLIGYLPMAKGNDAFILLLTIGFEAGRQFQKENPKLALGPSVY